MEPSASNWKSLWLFAIAVAVLIFLILPVLIVVPMSFSAARFLEFPPTHWSLRWYAEFLASDDWYAALMTSLKVATSTACLAVPIGVAAAYAIHQGNHPLFRRLQTVMLMPIMVPNLILAIGIYYVYVRLSWLGTFYGLVLAHTMLALPFVVVTALSGLRSFDMSQEMVARTLGCTRLRAFLTVTLPQIKGSILTGILFAFITSMDEVVVALFVSAGDNMTVTKVMFERLRDEMGPLIAVVSSVLIGASLLLVACAALAARLGAQRAPTPN
jgi:putative spermidine/putrescine transport system permease protein